MVVSCVNHDLVRRAELWATGATIHDVKQLLGCYRSACEALDSPRAKRASKRKIESIKAFRDWAVKTLEAFMSHGDYKKANRDNPMPSVID